MGYIKNLRRTATIGIAIAFSLYWAATIYYLLPNKVRTHALQPVVLFFDHFLFQKWTFFAPPPQRNTRLYYTFIPKSGESLQFRFELMETIGNEKRRNAPFNERATIVDYVLSGSVDQITRYISSTAVPGTPSRRLFDAKMNLNPFRTLRNYASIIAESNSLEREKYWVVISAVAVPIRPIGADPLEENRSEALIFQTRRF